MHDGMSSLQLSRDRKHKKHYGCGEKKERVVRPNERQAVKYYTPHYQIGNLEQQTRKDKGLPVVAEDIA